MNKPKIEEVVYTKTVENAENCYIFAHCISCSHLYLRDNFENIMCIINKGNLINLTLIT